MQSINSLVLFALATLPACAAAIEEPAPLTTVSASQLGASRWEIGGEGDRTITGRDDAGEAVIEAIVTRDSDTPDSRVHIEVLSPDPAGFDLLSTGEVLGETSPIATQIAHALFDDLGHQTKPLDQPPETRSTVYLNGTIYLGWSLFGYAAFQYVGQPCPTVNRSEDSGTFFPSTTVRSCTLDWMSPSRNNCLARIDFVMPPDRWGYCSWHIDIEGPATP